MPWIHWGTLILWSAALFVSLGLPINRFAAWRAERARAWPITTGRVVETGSHTKRICNSGSGRRGVGACHDQHFADIIYEYSIDGSKHRSGTLTFDSAGGSHRDDVQALLERYRQGTEVTVHYDPEDPSDAYLETVAMDQSSRRFDQIGLIAAALFAIGILYNLIWRYQAGVGRRPG